MIEANLGKNYLTQEPDLKSEAWTCESCQSHFISLPDKHLIVIQSKFQKLALRDKLNINGDKNDSVSLLNTKNNFHCTSPS